MKKSELISELEHAQECLWYDLYEDLRLAHNDYWSIGCESKIGRIFRIARLVGPTPWEKIPYPLLINDVYQTILSHFKLEPIPEIELDDEHRDAYSRPAWSESCKTIKKLTPAFYM